MAIPTRYFNRRPITVSTLDIGVNVLFKQQESQNLFIANRACNVYWCEFVITNLIEVNSYILWHDHLRSAADLTFLLVHQTYLHVDGLCLFNLKLSDQSHQLLLWTSHSNHVADLVDKQHLVLLFGLG
jgi:hypothetical protein